MRYTSGVHILKTILVKIYMPGKTQDIEMGRYVNSIVTFHINK